MIELIVESLPLCLNTTPLIELMKIGDSDLELRRFRKRRVRPLASGWRPKRMSSRVKSSVGPWLKKGGCTALRHSGI
jgi:hypothetical protein